MANNPKVYHFELPRNDKTPFVPIKEEVHLAFQWLTRNRSRSRGRDVFEVIDTIVIHATAGYATQHVIDTWRSRKASAHWLVPDDNEPQHNNFVWATVAEAQAAYHVGAVDYEPHIGRGTNVNNRSLGVEIVNTQDVQNYTDPFSTWQVKAAAQIILYAWSKYPNMKHVISHAKLEPTRRSDLGSNFPWDNFKKLVLSHSALGIRDPLVNANYTPQKPIAYEGNCCEP